MFVDKTPNWIENLPDEELYNHEMIQIISFYVLCSPVAGLSAMRKSLGDYNWNTPWKKPYYLNRQLKQAASNYCLLYASSSYDLLEDAIQKSETLREFPNNIEDEAVAFYNCKNNQFMSVFYHIRNSIAHGRFIKKVNNSGEKVYVMEDVVEQKKNPMQDKLSARMVLYERTLLSWINVIQNGECRFIPHTQ